MLFQYNIELDNSRETTGIKISNFIKKYRLYLAISMIGFMLLLLSSTVIALAFFSIGFISTYGYRMLHEILNISFTTEIDGFDLRNVIDDLERR